MLIDASHNEETRVVVLESKRVEDFDFESLKKLQLSGNIYLAKVTRVEPSLQAAFLDYGGNRHGFLAFSEIHPDYYQIPLEERLGNKTKGNNNDTSRKVTRKKSNDSKASNVESVANEQITSNVILDEDIGSDKADPSPKLQTNKDTIVNQEEKSTTNSQTESLVSEEIFIKKQHRKFRIQEVIKVRQILLIQIVKEERGNKGAALTTYLSLAGRYCVLMPNTPRGGGISRKITNLADRKKLKEIANSLLVPEGSGLIIRTAGSNRTKLEIKRDYEYLIRQWEQVRDLTLSSIAPSTIYEEGSLIKRAIRDLYSRTIDEILVEGDRGYREAKDYMKMLMPSHAKNVKKYEQTVPLFSKYQVEDHLAAMFNPIAQLRSGGYIVIDVTEALVAVDVNSGRATKESSIEDTALKTNLEAAEELSRQIKLRDLAGLIVIDFIDMEDRKNNIAVEKRMKDRLKNDRARTQVGRISMFGLLEMSRQRLRPGMIETSTQPCEHCHGTGITRSDDSLSLAILRELEEEGLKLIYETLALKVPTNIANYMLNEKRDRIGTIEKRYNLVIKIEAQNNLISPDYSLEKVKGITILPNSSSSVKIDNQIIKDDEVDKEATQLDVSINSFDDETSLDDNQGKRRRRRRRKPKQRPTNSINQNESELSNNTNINDTSETISSSPKPEIVGEKQPDDISKHEIKKEKVSRLTTGQTRKNDLKTNQTLTSTSLIDEDSKLNVKGQSNSTKKATTKKTSLPKETMALENKDRKVPKMNSKSKTNEDEEKAEGEAASKKSGWWNKTKT